MNNEQHVSTLASEPTNNLSREETREILTPFAFEVDKTLFGIALAAPYKRGIALLIDLFAILILSSAPGELLAIVLAITFYKLGSDKRAQALGKERGQKRRKMLRVVGAFIVFVLLTQWLPRVFNHEIFGGTTPENTLEREVSPAEELDLASTIIVSKTILELTKTFNESQCKSIACWRSVITPTITADAIVSLDLNRTFIEKSIAEVVKKTQLDKADAQQLEQYLFQAYSSAKTDYAQSKGMLSAQDKLADNDYSLDSSAKIPEQKKVNEFDIKTPVDDMQEKPIYSIIEYLKAFINDLGLGFGWAAFYFTVLTSIWKGQTLGKKLMSIKVLQLDGTPLSMWDSFGRYGGYGAGIATGLIGFVQIYWDANRQAIHDKISSTVVIDVTSAKVSLQNNNGACKND